MDIGRIATKMSGNAAKTETAGEVYIHVNGDITGIDQFSFNIIICTEG